MAKIQKTLFSWQEVDALSDLKRLQLALDNLPDEELMRALERERGRGRDDYPVRAMWNSLIAAGVYQHPSIECLRRELGRNAQLRQACGFDLFARPDVPPACAYSRFLRALQRHAAVVEAVFRRLVEQLGEELPDFGAVLAVDGKKLPTHARPRPQDAPRLPADGRRDIDADFGVKKRQETGADGKVREYETRWYGYRLHLVVDANHELPVAYNVTRASCAEQPRAHDLLDKMRRETPRLLTGCEAFLGDKGYDDGKLITRLWDDHAIKPVIDIRDCWQDGEATRRVAGTRDAVYSYCGEVRCHARAGETHRMAYGGFEESRATQKYLCPAKHYGFDCPRLANCELRGGLRIPLSEERRIFTPPARGTPSWRRLYKKRSAIERVNSRLDVSFGFEHHFIRGLAKMRLRVTLALTVMLGMALGRIKEKQRDKMRSLVAA